MINRRKNIEQFIDYCTYSQMELKNKLHKELQKYYSKVKYKDGFVFAKGTLPVMLVAHMDTVHKIQCTRDNIYVNAKNNIITSSVGIGGDDRCGVYMIMEILRTTYLRPSILFVEDEEIGSVGASKFIKRYDRNNLKLNFIIELDRRNADDSVYYDLDNIDFENYINKFGFETAFGSFTDICELCPVLNCAGVNLSCGYYQEHTTSHYVVFSEMYDTIRKVINILSEAKDTDYFEYKQKPYRTAYGWYDYGAYGAYTGYQSKDARYLCDYCGYSCDGEFDETYACICKDCARTYQMKKCGCGVWTENKNGICDFCISEDCKYLSKEVEQLTFENL